MTTSCLRCDDGTVVPLHVERWQDDATLEELELLFRVQGPAIDLGCGPGRLLVALGERGVPAIGVDASPSAVAAARARGGLVLERSIFSRLPGTGRWGSALLLDGNIGIGGDPQRLLLRAAALLRTDGSVFVEVGSPGSATRSMQVEMDLGGHRSMPFPWAVVAADDLAAIAASAGLGMDDLWEAGGRWFSQLAIV